MRNRDASRLPIRILWFVMPEIYDNLDSPLGAALRQTLAGSTRLDACVGYFNLRGWKEIADAVAALPFGTGASPPVRLLIGMNTGEHPDLRSALGQGRFQRNTNRQANRLRQATESALREQLAFRVPSTRDETTLRTLRAQLEEGRVHVKMHLAFALHAKLYLCHMQDRTAADRKGFLGSSNLTYAGLQRQGELNIDVLDGDATHKLQAWFDERWADRLSVDANCILIQLLDASWVSQRTLPPYLIHLKLAYHLSRDARQGLIEFDVPTAIRSKLLDFQTAAVRITARRIMVQGGAMIADVVGLGKTMTATGVALTLQERHGYETLIIAPKNLVDMWQEYLDEYRLLGRVLSRTQVHNALPALRRFRLVVIDESHHLRTRNRRDYRYIRDYITQNEPKVLLLTATPFNRSMEDVANQLGLFLSDDTPLPVRPEAALRREGEYAFKTRCRLDNLNSLSAMRRSEEVEDWQRLLSHYLIRRTRSFIEENYAEQDAEGRTFLVLGKDRRRFYLPRRRPKKLEWQTAGEDPAAVLEGDAVLDAIGALSLPRYQLQNFLNAAIEPAAADAEVLERFATGSRGNLLGITRVMLYKRLSSSGYSFVLSLRRHLLHNYVMLHGLTSEDMIPVGTYDAYDGAEFNDESDEETWTAASVLDPACPPPDWDALAKTTLAHLKTQTPASVTLLPSRLFAADLQTRLREDNRILQSILARVPVWSADKDSKLKSLFRLLAKMHGGDKILVFTEFADTAQYLYRELTNLRLSGGLGLITGSRASAESGIKQDALAVARAFSPRSVGVSSPPEPVEHELRVVIATDVLSEGLNLQDCAVVVNFDLPWAIIKLIQRAGRVDRIGQEAAEVTIYSVCPTDGVEAVIDLRGRIRRRLFESAAVLGSDERFFGDREEEAQVRSFFDENSVLSTLAEEDVDYTSKAYEIWRMAELNHPDLAKRAESLPDQAHATRARDREAKGVLAYAVSRHAVDHVFFQPVGGALQSISPLEALARTACAPDTPGLPRQDDHHDVVAEIMKAAEQQAATRTIGSLAGIRKRAYDRLRALIEQEEKTLFPPSREALAAVETLYEHPLTEMANQRLSGALRGGVQRDQDVMDMVVDLHRNGMLVVERHQEDDEIQLVCSLGFA